VAKPIRKKEIQRRRVAREQSLPLGKDNFRIIGVGLLVILAGYLAMLTGSVEGFLPLVVSPILLVVGYCVIVPAGIIYRKKEKPAGAAELPTRA
jgi:hypothetical protein